MSDLPMKILRKKIQKRSDKTKERKVLSQKRKNQDLGMYWDDSMRADEGLSFVLLVNSISHANTTAWLCSIRPNGPKHVITIYIDGVKHVKTIPVDDPKRC